MAKYRIGFIGIGNMGGALATAVCSEAPEGVIVNNRTRDKSTRFAAEHGCDEASYEIVARNSEVVVIGTLPGAVGEVVRTIYPYMKQSGERKVLVSMASGVTVKMLEDMTGPEQPIVRIMPNTPVAVGAGLILYCAGAAATPGDVAKVKKCLAPAGKLDELPESLFNAGSTVAGCGPAWAAMFIEALADGGVKCGLPRSKALYYAEQMLFGATALALKTGKHPGALKDEVCSPGGSTIEGVQALEEGAFRASVMKAVQAAWEKHK